MSVAGSKFLLCSVWDIHAVWVFQRHIWQKGDTWPVSNLTARSGITLLPLVRQNSNKDAIVQPILILSSVTSMIFIVGFGASTTYTMAILMRLAGGLCNFTFGCAHLYLSDQDASVQQSNSSNTGEKCCLNATLSSKES